MATQKMGKWKFTDEEIEEQVHESAKLGEAELERPASEIRFSSSGKVVTLRFPDGFVLGFPSSQIKELRNAAASEIFKGRLTESGDAIHWDNLDAHYTVVGLLAGRFGTTAWMQEIGKKGGSQKSEAKVAASRINGGKGGRPRKTGPERLYNSEAERKSAVTGAWAINKSSDPSPARAGTSTQKAAVAKAKKATANRNGVRSATTKITNRAISPKSTRKSR